MIEPYRLENLPLETPDDDLRWAAYVDVFSNAFLESRATDEGLEFFREHARADSATLGMVTAEGPGLDGRQPIAGFAWADISVNCGKGPVPAMVINLVAVRSTHRRRGLARAMMEHHLEAGRSKGHALAVLTASEATIYGRFGFGIANRYESWEIDVRRFQMRPDVEVAAGSLEILTPETALPIFERILGDYVAMHRGAYTPQAMHATAASGRWRQDEGGPDRRLRYLVHFDDASRADGFAIFRHGGWPEEDPNPTAALAVCATTLSVERALWQGLASFDLIRQLNARDVPLGNPLPNSLVDSRAVSRKGTQDGVWLRILDLPKAVSQRRFDFDGAAVVKVVDPMGFCDGIWEISASDGDAKAVPSDRSPGVMLGVDTLARLWHGDVTALELAKAGIVHGDQVAGFSHLFATVDAPANLVHF